MKERKGAFGEVVGGIAQGIAGTVKRRQQDREPKVVLYDSTGLAQTLPHGAPGRDDIVATAGRLIELANGLPKPDADDADADAGAAAADAQAQADAAEVDAAEAQAEATEAVPPTTEAEADTDR